MTPRLRFCLAFFLTTACAHSPREVERAPVADLHQHLFGPGTLELSPSLPRVVARDLIRLLDSAGIRRALVLSVAYQFSNPNRPPFADEYARVKAENDWTAAQASEFPDRLLAFCGVNPVRDYALEEIARCAADPRLRSGLKLHIGNSDVNFEDSVHLERVRAVFRAANANRMAIVLHLRPSVTRQRPYGERIARIFLTEVIGEAPDVPIQIAHMGGAGLLNDPPADEALEFFVRAIAENDARMRNVYFDVSGISGVGSSPEISARLATRIRQLGPRRVVFGSDAAVRGNSPMFSLTAFRKVPLSKSELTIIVENVPPYLRGGNIR